MKKCFLILFLLSIVSCSRYEDNDCMCLTSIANRLNGVWKINTIEVNAENVDVSLASWNNKVIQYYVFELISDSKKKRKNEYFSGELVVRDSTYSSMLYRTVNIIDKRKINIYSKNDNPTGGGKTVGCVSNISIPVAELSYKHETWEILKLTNNDLWLKMEYDGLVYENRFVKIK